MPLAKRIAAVDLVTAVCGMNRGDATSAIMVLLNGNGKQQAEIKALLRRTARVKGFLQPTWVVTRAEAYDLLDFLPRQRTRDVIAFVDGYFTTAEKKLSRKSRPRRKRI